MAYALDTNTIIHLLQQTPTVITRRDAAVAKGMQLIIPPYVNFEILRGFQYVPAPTKEELYKDLCNHCPIEEMNAEVWLKAAALYGDLRRKKFTMGDADLLIAAFCIVNGYTLVTNNIRHFEVIDGLKIEDWTAG